MLIPEVVLFVGTISPGLAVPEASTTSLVLPADAGLNGAGPDDVDPARSHGFGGGPPPELCKQNSKSISKMKEF